MAALLTGRTPSFETSDSGSPLRINATRCGLARFSDRSHEDQCIPTSVSTLAERLREAGYWTIGVASNAALYKPAGFQRGFDDWVEVGDRRIEQSPLLRALDLEPSPDFLRNPWASRHGIPVNSAALEAVARRPGDRFFLYVHYMDVHDYEFRKVDYRRGVRDADKAIGRLLGELESEGLLDEAVIVVTSDHGHRLGERHALEGKRGHLGNPSFQEVLEIPLIIAPPVLEDPGIPILTQDLHYLILEIAGLVPERAEELAAGEIFLGEAEFRTYVNGRWKSTVRRRDGEHFLFDLTADPGERANAAGAAPDVAAAHLRRIDQLARSLAAEGSTGRRGISQQERETLEVLGYLEEDP
jgi:arylsulfatase A-like enzyme